jgi:polyhydroxyalkanoate synthesis regulator phasin
MSKTRFAYDVSTGEHVMLGKTNVPTSKEFNEDIMKQEAKRKKRLERKQRQRAKKREDKCKDQLQTQPESLPDTHETRIQPPQELEVLKITTERLRSARCLHGLYFRDTCFSLLYQLHPSQRPFHESEAEYASHLQRATEEWVAVMVLYRRAIQSSELTLQNGMVQVVQFTEALQGDDSHKNVLYVASLAAWREQLREVVGI